MTDERLTNAALLATVLDIEARRAEIAGVEAAFTQRYDVGGANLLKEALEQRRIMRDAKEYADALLSTPDLPDDEG